MQHVLRFSKKAMRNTLIKIELRANYESHFPRYSETFAWILNPEKGEEEKGAGKSITPR